MTLAQYRERGWYICSSNSETCPCWLVMRWGRVVHQERTLRGAAEWLCNLLDDSDVNCR